MRHEPKEEALLRGEMVWEGTLLGRTLGRMARLYVRENEKYEFALTYIDPSQPCNLKQPSDFSYSKYCIYVGVMILYAP